MNSPSSLLKAAAAVRGESIFLMCCERVTAWRWNPWHVCPATSLRGVAMRTLLTAVAFALALSAPGFAADLPLKAPPVPVAAPAFSWTGWYVGLTAGGEWGHADARTSTVFSPTGYFATSSVPAIAAAGAQHVGMSGGTVGGELGYNWQFGSAVFGAETDFEYFGLKGSTTSSALYPCCAPTSFTISSNVKTDWLFTLRPRLGFAVDHWLLY